jgi:hypothetical protein
MWRDKCIGVLTGKLAGKIRLGLVVVDGRIILKCILNLMGRRQLVHPAQYKDKGRVLVKKVIRLRGS